MIPMVEDRHLGGYVAGGDPGTWTPQLWEHLVDAYDIRSVLDVGCGEGHSTRFFRSLGCDVLGVDGCAQAIRDSVLPGSVTLHDFCDGPFDPGRRFDLVWSCEFLEHIDEQYLPNVLATLALADKAIAVTHAFPGQPGHHHVNCQPTSYWIEMLAGIGYDCRLTDTVAARRATWGDYHRLNHFGRSGLVATPLAGAKERPLPEFSAFQQAAAQPSWSTRGKELALKGHSKLGRTWLKMTKQAVRKAA